MLQGASDYDLSNSQYGLIFVPQVILAITGSLLLPALSRRFGLKGLSSPASPPTWLR